MQPTTSRQNTEQFVEELQRFQSELTNYVYASLGDHQKAEDIVQEVFLRVCCYEREHSIENLRAFLYECTRRAVTDEIRRSYRKRTLSLGHIPENLPAPAPDPDELTLEEAWDLIESVVPLLSEQDRALITAYRQEQTFVEIAAHFGISVGSVWYRILKVCDTLRERGVKPAILVAILGSVGGATKVSAATVAVPAAAGAAGVGSWTGWIPKGPLAILLAIILMITVFAAGGGDEANVEMIEAVRVLEGRAPIAEKNAKGKEHLGGFVPAGGMLGVGELRAVLPKPGDFVPPARVNDIPGIGELPPVIDNGKGPPNGEFPRGGDQIPGLCNPGGGELPGVGELPLSIPDKKRQGVHTFTPRGGELPGR